MLAQVASTYKYDQRDPNWLQQIFWLGFVYLLIFKVEALPNVCSIGIAVAIGFSWHTSIVRGILGISCGD